MLNDDRSSTCHEVLKRFKTRDRRKEPLQPNSPPWRRGGCPASGGASGEGVTGTDIPMSLVGAAAYRGVAQESVRPGSASPLSTRPCTSRPQCAESRETSNFSLLLRIACISFAASSPAAPLLPAPHSAIHTVVTFSRPANTAFSGRTPTRSCGFSLPCCRNGIFGMDNGRGCR
jgi:hypothetical protein